MTSVNRRMRIMIHGVTLLATMGIAGVIPALPSLATSFALPVEDTWLVLTAFALPGLLCIPGAGVCADRFGRKKVLVFSLLLFALGGLGCACAQTYRQLLFFRILQGVGGAPLSLLYPTIIGDAWQGEERLKMMSHAAVTLGLGTAVNPALGGALAVLDWRLAFLPPLFALPVALLALRLPLTCPRERTSFRLYAAAAIRHARDRRARILFGLTLLTFIMLSGPIITCFPLLAEKAFAASPLESGLIISLASLASGLAATQLPKLYRRFSDRKLLFASLILYALSLLSMPFVPALWWIAPAVGIYGLAQGLNIPLVSTFLTDLAPDAQRAGLMAVNAVLRRLGQSIGPALFGLLAGRIGPGNAIAAGTGVVVCMAWLIFALPPSSETVSAAQAPTRPETPDALA